jgi:hypothetical protein
VFVRAAGNLHGRLQQADHQAHRQPRPAGRADAAAEFAFKRTGEIAAGVLIVKSPKNQTTRISNSGDQGSKIRAGK